MVRLLLPLLLVLSACGADADGDGVRGAADCDDSDPDVNEEATEVCDGKDNDCDGDVDEGVTTSFYADEDGDDFGDPDAVVERCEAEDDEVEDNTDCNDDDPESFPGADEFCDGVDNDCDGDIDEADALDAANWYRDTDGDGFGADDDTTLGCDPGDGWELEGGDCDEGDTDINPGADEICDDVDNDCDGDIDEDEAIDATRWYADLDDDGFGDPENSRFACEQPEDFVIDDMDCDDEDEDEFPGVMWYPDGDTDGFGDETAMATLCERSAPTDVSNNRDCDDTDASISPAVLETWYDGVDSNCDGADDYDLDGDGERSSTEFEGGLDCDDADPTVNTSATEVEDSRDNDCNGLCDEGFISTGEVIISEIHKNPSAVDDADGEWIELYNTTGDDVVVCGWELFDDDTDSTILEGPFTVPASGYAVIGNNSDTMTNGNVSLDYEYSGFDLANGADEVVLDFDGTLMDAVRYDDGPDFPDPTGASMVLDPSALTESENDDGANWCVADSAWPMSAGDLGSPGFPNTCTP
jgi:hypothetical protein